MNDEKHAVEASRSNELLGRRASDGTPDGDSSRNINDYINDAERALNRMGDYACDDLDTLNAFIFLCGIIEGVQQATKLRIDTRAV